MPTSSIQCLIYCASRPIFPDYARFRRFRRLRRSPLPPPPSSQSVPTSWGAPLGWDSLDCSFFSNSRQPDRPSSERAFSSARE